MWYVVAVVHPVRGKKARQNLKTTAEEKTKQFAMYPLMCTVNLQSLPASATLELGPWCFSWAYETP